MNKKQQARLPRHCVLVAGLFCVYNNFFLNKMPKKKSKKIYHLIGNTTTDAAATEYIKPGGKINITSHGLGSGIYGLSIPYYERNKRRLPRYLSEGKKLVVKINRPYILTSSEHCNSLIRWSTAINDTLQKFKKKFLSGLKKERGVKPREKLSLKLISSLCATQFNKFSERKLTAKKCRTALRKFLKDYSSRKDYVCMPINYILGELRYDGIYAGGTSCDSMSKGNIKFMCPYEKAKTVLVNKIKVRSGVENTPITLDFQKIKGKFLRHPPMFTPEFFDWKMKHGMWVPSRYRKGRKAKK